ncbi:MAG: hypothetical protein QGG54_20810, partial [Gammaproteobacteria bacterium]|nr:hypothetical protein [Gammaproteobacteria bacterium]
MLNKIPFPISNKHWQSVFSVVFLSGVLIFVIGCGSSGADIENFVQIRDAPSDYTIADLKTFGFKTAKQYDIEGL